MLFRSETDLIDVTGICQTPIEVFETLNVSMTLNVVTSANTIETVYTAPILNSIGIGNLYSYLSGNTNSGFYVCGGSPSGATSLASCTPLILNITGVTYPNVSSCNTVMNSLVNDLYSESGLSGVSSGNTIFINSLSQSAFTSNWLNFNAVITDPAIISAITNQNISLTINVNDTCCNICVLLDNIQLNKDCTNIDNTSFLLTESPGFELDRIRDNKKSWVANSIPVNRSFSLPNISGTTIIRETNYNVNDERLVINTKEIDLDVNLAQGVETDVWCYISNNPCILTGITYCNPCAETCGSKQFEDGSCFEFMDGQEYDFMDATGSTNMIGYNGSYCCGDNQINFVELLTQPLSGITTIDGFEDLITSELIDAKNRQTISGYATLRALYDRYLNTYPYCGNNSNAYTYLTMDQFANLIGNYWVDIVEQVVPATTIWGSVKIYSNTIFDQQKFKYKSYTSLFCNNPFSGQTVSSPINGTSGACTDVSVTLTSVYSPSTGSTIINFTPPISCSTICQAQMNVGSEFIGNVYVLGGIPNCSVSSPNTISECALQAGVDVEYPTAYLNVYAAKAPIGILWSNGQTGATITVPSGNYSVTVTDATCCSTIIDFVMPAQPITACWYSMLDSPDFVVDTLICGPSTAITFNVDSIIVNGIELVTSSGYTATIDSGVSGVTLVPASNSLISGCTMGPTGVTYTDFVNLLNTAFSGVGLTQYTAQISLVEITGTSASTTSGFYIVYPNTDTFAITAYDSLGNIITYTQDAIAYIGSGSAGITCENITLINGIVIE